MARLPLLFTLIRLPLQSSPNFQALHTAYSLSQCLEQTTVSFTTQSSVTENAVDRQTRCYANQQAFGGLRHWVMQLLLWEQRRKTNQLSGLKSWAINSSFNQPEQNFLNICKLHPTYFHTKRGNPWETSP